MRARKKIRPYSRGRPSLFPANPVPPGEAGSLGRAAETLRLSRGYGHASDDAFGVGHTEGGCGNAAPKMDEKFRKNRPGIGGEGRLAQEDSGGCLPIVPIE